MILMQLNGATTVYIYIVQFTWFVAVDGVRLQTNQIKNIHGTLMRQRLSPQDARLQLPNKHSLTKFILLNFLVRGNVCRATGIKKM